MEVSPECPHVLVPPELNLGMRVVIGCFQMERSSRFLGLNPLEKLYSGLVLRPPPPAHNHLANVHPGV